MSAWSSSDPESFGALFSAAAGDPAGTGHLRDLSVYVLERTESKAKESMNPPVVVKMLCRAMTERGLSSLDWANK